MLSNQKMQAMPETTDISPMTIGNRIVWKPSGLHKGRGVFALVDFKKDELIEQSPVTVVSKAEAELFEDGTPEEDSVIDQYLLRWKTNTKGSEYCMGHGFLMLYNHHPKPTGYLVHDFDFQTISMVAARDIKAGEEITFDYDCEIWFDVQA